MPETATFDTDAFASDLVKSDSSYSNDIIQGHHARDLFTALIKLGAKPAKASSKCSVASQELHLRVNDKHINIVEANFMVQFTDVTVTTR